MHILITNDDGINSAGLKALSDAAVRRGHEVLIIAPSEQCSANGQHITLIRPLVVHSSAWEGGKAYAVDGTPADCVRLAQDLTDGWPLDFCLSGINNGDNAGTSLYYSGTAAGAREAAMQYLPAMAVSLEAGGDGEMRSALAERAIRMAEKCQGVRFPRFSFINLNAPARPPREWKEMKVCPLSEAYFLDRYERRVNPRGDIYFWLKQSSGQMPTMESHAPGTDLDELHKGHITCTLVGGFGDLNAEFSAKMQDFME